MKIENIINQFSNVGSGKYYAFETFMLNVLKVHLEKQSKELLSYDSIRDQLGDAIAPEGFDEFHGPTVIEFSLSLRTEKIYSIINRTSNFSNNIEDKLRISNILFITPQEIPKIIKERINIITNKEDYNLRIVVWGPNEIDKILNQHKEYVNTIINNLFKLRIDSSIRKSQNDWKSEREDIIQNIKDEYRKGTISLLLGAGVSLSAGIPDWSTLIKALMVNFLTSEFSSNITIESDDINEIAQQFKEFDTQSALVAARYIRLGINKGKDDKEFVNAVTECLYKSRDLGMPLNSKLIIAISAMCMPRRTGAKVKSIITYNFDDLIERELKNQNIPCKSIYLENHSYDQEELPVFHVHGFLPEENKHYKDLDKSKLILSEEGYHQIYSEPYHWSNLVQLNDFRENHCLMIGLSMSDPNLRRLLDISARNIEKTRHYAFLPRISLESFILKKNGIKIKNENIASDFLIRHHVINEEIMKELGVSIIWYENYDEIPDILSSITLL